MDRAAPVAIDTDTASSPCGQACTRCLATADLASVAWLSDSSAIRNPADAEETDHQIWPRMMVVSLRLADFYRFVPTRRHFAIERTGDDSGRQDRLHLGG